MQLSDVDIIDIWHSATDKAATLDWLAVHCRTTRDGMRKRLDKLECSLPEPEPEQKTRRGGSKPKLDFDAARRLYDEGLTDGKIAKQLGVAPQTVNNWRRREGLPAHGINPYLEKQKAKEGQQARDEAILASVDAGKRSELEPCDPCEPTSPECDACEEKREAAPLCPEDAWASETLHDIYGLPVPSHIRMEPREEAEPETEPFTLGQLRRYLMQFLPAALNDAALCIDGEAVHEFYGFSVTQPDGVATVDLLTRRRR